MRKLIIAPSFLSKSLYQSFFEDDKFYDAKIISKEELFTAINGGFDETSIISLMSENNFSYQEGMMYLKYLPYINKDSKNKKINNLFLLKENLIKNGHSLSNEYDVLMYQNQEVDIYGYSESDVVLSNIIKHLSIKPTFKKLSSKKITQNDVLEFVNIEDEAFYTMNQIASLIDKGIKVEDILIYSKDSNYDYFFNLFGLSFNYKIQTKSQDSFYCLGISYEFLKIYKEEKDLVLAINKLKEEVKDDPFLLDLINLINRNIYHELTFEKQLDLLINTFKETKIPNKKYSGSVQVIDKPTFVKGKHIFIIGFRNGLFPNVVKDNEYLNDLEKEEIGMNDSLIESKSNHDFLLDFLASENTFYYSYSLRSSSSNYYVSPLVIELSFNVIKGKFPDVIYSSTYADFYYTKALDNDHLYKEKNNEFFSLSSICKIDYCSYDNQIKKVCAIEKDDQLTLSYTSIDRYFNCPFSFYLDRVVKLDDFESTFNQKIGEIAHYVFQHCYDRDFDFDESFEIAKKQQGTFTNKEELLLLGLKEDINKAVKANLLHINYIKNPSFFTEKKFTISLDEHTSLEGRIDKGIIIDDKYLAIIDYKTGSKGFDEKKMNLGLSLQLPIYCYLSSFNEEYKDYQISGIYINNVIPTSRNDDTAPEELISEYLKLNGKTLQDDEFVKDFDSSIGNGKSSFVNSLRYKADGSLTGASLIGQDIFNEYVETAKEKVEEAKKLIRDNNFVIAPKYVKSDTACKYCPYRDVCFLNPKQIIYVENNDEEEDEE